MSRCPNGYRKHRKTGKCTSKRHLERTRRCKNGTRKSKKTGHCETKRSKSRSFVTAKSGSFVTAKQD
jgi:hypothetical protein